MLLVSSSEGSRLWEIKLSFERDKNAPEKNRVAPCELN